MTAIVISNFSALSEYIKSLISKSYTLGELQRNMPKIKKILDEYEKNGRVTVEGHIVAKT